MERVRISVSNLVLRFRVGEGGEPRYFGLLNRKSLEKGRRVASAVGGAALVSPEAKSELEGRYGAEFLEGMDARFVVPATATDEILDRFALRDPAFYEIDVLREATEELTTKELPLDAGPALAASDMAEVRFVFVRGHRVLPSSGGGSARELKGIPSRRYFNLFEMIVTPRVAEKLAAHPAIVVLTDDEVATTKHGTAEGMSHNGVAIADNIFSI